MLLICSYLLTLTGCRISEDLLEDTLQEVGNELDHVCDDFAEALYNDEFASVSSDYHWQSKIQDLIFSNDV